MASKKIQLYTDRANTIEASPETSANCVILSDGNDLQKVLDNDLTNPTVVHEETSFKVGVGDIDVSSSVVDGEVGRMVIKGKTYQNILPEPSTHVLTNNKEMFKVNEGLDPNVEIVDAVSKSAILKGQTLVNLVSSYAFHGDSLLYESRFYDKPIQSGETLTVFVVNPNISTIKVGLFSSSTGGWQREQVFDVSIIKKVVFTVPSGYISKYVGVVVDNPRDSTGFENGLVVAQGDQSHLEVNTYFEGMKSVKMPVLTTTGKNLFNGEIIIGKDINDFNGTVIDRTNHTITSKFAVPKNKKYKVSSDRTLSYCIAHYYKNDDTWLGRDLIYNKSSNDRNVLDTSLYDYDYLRLEMDEEGYSHLQIEEGTTATPYEPNKTNILHTPEEVVLRSLPNGVCDTLNLMTGEYIQRIGEVVLDGTQNWTLKTGNWEFENTFGFTTTISDMINTTQSHPAHSNGNSLVCSHFPSYGGNSLSNNALPNDIEMVGIDLNRVLGLRITKTKLSTPNAEGLKAWLQANPVTVQYELQTPIVKTVDLSSSGNWEKIVFNGSENWSVYPRSSSVNFVNTIAFQTNTIPNAISTENLQLFSESFRATSHYGSDVEGIFMKGTMRLSIKKSRLMSQDVDGLKQYLQQNPLTVWYQTVVHQDSTQVKQPIFFKDGHIQLSSGADNSLIPTLDYQAKTSNSYVMDLMKANTRYTMKAKSASGTFTIDGTSYGAGTNGTFTTPSSMTNKFLVMSNKTNEEVMILEGDVVSKTIPYFKGIKSAFEDESKIEVLSTSQNILDTSKIVQGDLLNSGIIGATGGSADLYCYTEEFIPCPNIKHPLYVHRTIDGVYSSSTYYIFFFDEDKRLLQPRTVSNTFTIPDGAKYLRIMVHKGNVDVSRVGIMVTNSGADRFNQSVGGLQNSTKIPLLSPLRSLPNGTCDELIIDRMKKKATLVQRVGVDIYNGSETWGCYNESSSKTVEGYHHTVQNLGGGANNTNLLSNSFRANYRSIHNRDEEGVGSQQDATYSNVRICISRTRLLPLGYTVGQNQVAYFQKWLQSNPVTVLYPLLTPVVTEIDLENFPLVYKDGHIFLNSEIAPVIEIDYNVNQAQQIQANNETLQRHELDILDLDNLIVSFVNAEYNLRLLKFDMELSMMALAE